MLGEDIIKIRFNLIILSLIFFIFFVSSVSAEDNLTVNSTLSDDDFDTIQSLIDNVESGGSIHLENKKYSGNGSPINITKDISIHGSDTILDAESNSKIFIISKNTNVNIYGLTLMNGKSTQNGAAIDNFGVLTVYNSKFINNVAQSGAIKSLTQSHLIVHNSLFENNAAITGAAIDSYEANSKIINCTFVKNHSNEGGAIYNRFGDIQLIECNFTGNSAKRGGGIYNNRGYLLIHNSKFYSNSASHLGGGVKSWGACEIYDSVFKFNYGESGGGAYISEYNMLVQNCVFENNNAYEGGGVIADANGHLNIKDSYLNNNSAELGGGIGVFLGYLTLNDCTLTNNIASRNGGAIEVETYHADIQNAIIFNNNAKLGGGIYIGEIPVTIRNCDLNNNSASYGGAIYNSGNSIINNVQLTSHVSTNDGGAIFNKGELTLSDSDLNYNSAGTRGGSLFNSGKLTALKINSNFNTAKDGGAIYTNSEMILSNSKLNNNKAENGGVIYSESLLTVDKSEFSSNEALIGGVIYNSLNRVNITDSNFLCNKANEAAAIYTLDDCSILNSKFEKNQIMHSHGTIYVMKGNINISNTIFYSNSASDEGTCIFINEGNILINNSQFILNTAKSYGAAIDNSGNLNIVDSLFDGNQAYGAGAIDNGGDLIIKNSIFKNNKVIKNGGAIDNKGNMIILGSILENNMANGQGGAIIARRATNISHSIIYNNHDANGYAIFNQTWDECSFNNNWWGSNDPNFEKIFNFNVSDDFKWIIMKFTSSSNLLQYKNANLILSLNEVRDRNNNVSNLDSLELLPSFKFDLSLNNNDYYVSKGYVNLFVPIKNAEYVTAKINDQSISLSIGKNPISFRSNNIVEDYDGKITFKARIVDSFGNGVSGLDVVIKMASKAYHVKTDAKGYVSKTFSLTPGKYKVSLTCEGKKVNNKITIKKVLKAKNASKKKSKKIRYQASLKTSKGKPIVGKKIIFKIKGKKYSAKTNKKGIATVAFKNLKVGKYKITVKYLNSYVKTTLKVKK